MSKAEYEHETKVISVKKNFFFDNQEQLIADEKDGENEVLLLQKLLQANHSY